MGRVFVKGPAGFIGFDYVKPLAAPGFSVCSHEKMANYYDATLKPRHHERLLRNAFFCKIEGMFEGKARFVAMTALFSTVNIGNSDKANPLRLVWII